MKKIKISYKDGSSLEIPLEDINIVPFNVGDNNFNIPIMLRIDGINTGAILMVSSNVILDIDNFDKMEIV